MILLAAGLSSTNVKLTSEPVVPEPLSGFPAMSVIGPLPEPRRTTRYWSFGSPVGRVMLNSSGPFAPPPSGECEKLAAVSGMATSSSTPAASTPNTPSGPARSTMTVLGLTLAGSRFLSVVNANEGVAEVTSELGAGANPVRCGAWVSTM